MGDAMRLLRLIFALLVLAVAYPATAQTGGTTIEEDAWGNTPDGRPVQRYVMTNASGARVAVMALGAAVTEVWVPDRAGKLADVVLGYGAAADYAINNSAQIGLTIGRYAGRIVGARLKLGDEVHALATAGGSSDSVHGGPRGFGANLWTGGQVQTPDGPGVRFTLISPDGDQGFPGEMTVSVTYVWTADNRLVMDYQATTTKTTVVNLTQHSYFNMAGADSGDVLKQVLKIDADFYTESAHNNTPTDTPYDFSRGKTIGQDLMSQNPHMIANRGFLVNYVLRRSTIPNQAVAAATLTDPGSGRTLTLFTTEPGLTIYTANSMNTQRVMKGGITYPVRAGVALEAQHLPNSPNHPHFPSTTLMPGDRFQSMTILAFSAS
jgi:aldose 1-epimerase